MNKKIFLRTKTAMFEMELNEVGLTFLEYMLPSDLLEDFHQALKLQKL